jgi:CelD/BcsL family acetyltransferase involved in cellulose biosynthesis
VTERDNQGLGPGAPIIVHSSRDPARLRALCDEWRALFAAAGEPSPFLSWEWLSAWWRRFGARRPLWLLEARDGAGALAGVLALSGRAGLPGARGWQLLGNRVGGADGLDVLARPGSEAAARSALAKALLDGGGWDALDLEDLPLDSPTVTAVREAAARHGVRIRVERRFACPGFALRGGFEAHLRRVRRRETYGRRVRWLASQAGFRIEVVTAPGEAIAAMADFLRLHRLRWAAEGGSYGIPPGAPETFHLELAPVLAALGWLRLYRLLVGGRSIAAVYGLEVGGRFYYYQSGYDPAWSSRSPGLVLVGRTVEDAYARGLTAYDFLRGEEPYKLDWTAERRETCALRLRAPSLRAGAAAAAEGVLGAARSLARAVAPERLWGALRLARRRAEANAGGQDRG